MKLQQAVQLLLAPRLVPFLVRALLLVGALVALTQTGPYMRHVEAPMIALNARVTHETLSLLGVETTLRGDVVSASGPDAFSVQIVEGCTGLFVFVLLLGATIAFPARWRARILGLVLGASLIFVLNWLRIVTLFFVGRNYPDLFDELHVYVWQGLIIVLVTIYWYAWALRSAQLAVPAEA
jgi:exosortase H (IPTLxxWG-CTERM-specific)